MSAGFGPQGTIVHCHRRDLLEGSRHPTIGYWVRPTHATLQLSPTANKNAGRTDRGRIESVQSNFVPRDAGVRLIQLGPLREFGAAPLSRPLARGVGSSRVPAGPRHPHPLALRRRGWRRPFAACPGEGARPPLVQRVTRPGAGGPVPGVPAETGDRFVDHLVDRPIVEERIERVPMRLRRARDERRDPSLAEHVRRRRLARRLRDLRHRGLARTAEVIDRQVPRGPADVRERLLDAACAEQSNHGLLGELLSDLLRDARAEPQQPLGSRVVELCWGHGKGRGREHGHLVDHPDKLVADRAMPKVRAPGSVCVAGYA